MQTREAGRRLSAVLLVLGVLVAASACGPREGVVAARSAQRQPNIVFVLTDDLSSDLVRFMPQVLAMEHAGMSFTNYTVTDSLCCPSRSSIFTGEYPHDTHVYGNVGPVGGFLDFLAHGDESKVYALPMQAAGYRTAMMGKFLNGYRPAEDVTESTPYVPPGWNEWDVAGEGYHEYNYQLNEDHQVDHFGAAPDDYLTSVLSTRAKQFITTSAHADKPFMLEVATFAPHRPYVPAPEDAHSFPNVRAPRDKAFDRLPTDPPKWLRGHPLLTRAQLALINRAYRKRVQDVQSVDRLLATLESTVKSVGQSSNTIFVFSSDNGYHMGQYRLTPGKMTAFDTDIRVPLVVTGPGIAAGSTSAAVVQNIDLAPTFEALAGATTPSTVDGRSLVPLLDGTPPSGGWPTEALIEHRGPDRDPSDPDFPSQSSGNPPSYEAIRTTRYTYVAYRNGGREYYNRTRDPDELHNIYGQLSQKQRRALHDRLMLLVDCHGSVACNVAAEPR